MASNFHDACDLYLKVISMRDGILGMYRQSLMECEEAKDKLTKAMPGVSEGMVAALEQQTGMYESDLNILTAMYTVAVKELMPLLEKAVDTDESM